MKRMAWTSSSPPGARRRRGLRRAGARRAGGRRRREKRGARGGWDPSREPNLFRIEFDAKRIAGDPSRGRASTRRRRAIDPYATQLRAIELRGRRASSSAQRLCGGDAVLVTALQRGRRHGPARARSSSAARRSSRARPAGAQPPRWARSAASTSRGASLIIECPASSATKRRARDLPARAPGRPSSGVIWSRRPAMTSVGHRQRADRVERRARRRGRPRGRRAARPGARAPTSARLAPGERRCPGTALVASADVRARGPRSTACRSAAGRVVARRGEERLAHRHRAPTRPTSASVATRAGMAQRRLQRHERAHAVPDDVRALARPPPR